MAPDPEPGTVPAQSDESTPKPAPTWHIETGAGSLTYSVESGAGYDSFIHPPRGGEADRSDPGAPPAAALAAAQAVAAQASKSGAQGGGPLPMAALAAMLPGGLPSSPGDMEALLEQVVTAGAKNYVLPGMSVAIHAEVQRLWAETAEETPLAVWKGEVTAKVGATWRVQHPDGKVDFIAWDEAESIGTIGFRLLPADWPTPGSAPVAAAYQGAGLIIFPYEAGGEYTGGDRKGQRLPPRCSAAVIAVKLAIINAQVKIFPAASADESGQGELSGQLMEMVE